MNLPLLKLQEIVDDCLPASGSINFDNCQEEIKVPLYRNYGMISLGVEGDPSGGMKSGGAEMLRQQYATLVFKKNVKLRLSD